MDGPTDVQTDEWMNVHMDVWTNGCTDGLTGGRTDRRMHTWPGGRVKIRMDRWINRMHAWMDRGNILMEWY